MLPTSEHPPLARKSYEDALRRERACSRWPRDSEAQEARLKPFCLPEFRPTFSIQPDDLIFTIGSCFARNIEQHMIGAGFNVAVSRFEKICEDEGVAVKSNTLNKFVAQSIVNELRWALEPGAEFPMASIVEVKDGRYLDMQLAPGLLPTNFEAAVGTRRAVSSYMRLVKDAKVVVITLGLAEAWYDTELGLYTNMMPLKATASRFPGRFEHHVLEYNQLVATLRQMLGLLEQYGHPDFRMLLTVSPVALAMTFTDHDALVANSYSKAVQRAAAEAIVRENSRVDYLPTYESVVLSEPALAWRDDRAHVSTEIVRLNVLRMENAYSARTAGKEAGGQFDPAQVKALKLIKQANDHVRLGAFEQADDLFRQATDLAPNEVVGHVHWGDSLYRRQKWREAVRELQTAMDLGGGRYNIGYTLAKAYARLAMWEDAERVAKAEIDASPDTPGPYKVMIKALKETGRNSEAEAYRTRFRELTAIEAR